MTEQNPASAARTGADAEGDGAADSAPGIPSPAFAVDPGSPAAGVVSADELLDAADHAPEPLLRIPLLPSSPQLRRALRVALAVVVVSGVGFFAGAATHSANVHKAADASRQRVLLRLVGGTAALTMTDLSGPAGPGLLAAQMAVSVRNDGAEPATVAGVEVSQPGVEVTTPAARTVVQPGKSATFKLGIAVDCESAKLPARPDAVTLRLQDAPSHADRVTLPLTVAAATQNSTFALGSSLVGDFYTLCGIAALDDRPEVAYVGTTSSATPAHPSFGFKVSITDAGSRPRVIAPVRVTDGFPGVVLTSDLGATPKPIPTGSAAEVGVTLRVTDCAVLGRSLATENGVTSYVEIVGQSLPFGTQSADPRFQHVGPLSVALDAHVSGFEHDLLSNIAAACPALK